MNFVQYEVWHINTRHYFELAHKVSCQVEVFEIMLAFI